MEENIASLNGIVSILEDMDTGDQRLWAVVSSLRWVASELQSELEIDELMRAMGESGHGIWTFEN